MQAKVVIAESHHGNADKFNQLLAAAMLDGYIPQGSVQHVEGLALSKERQEYKTNFLSVLVVK